MSVLSWNIVLPSGKKNTMVQEQLVNENGQINIGTHSAIRWDKRIEAMPKETAQTAAIILHCPLFPYLCFKTQLSFILEKGNQTYQVLDIPFQSLENRDIHGEKHLKHLANWLSDWILLFLWKNNKNISYFCNDFCHRSSKHFRCKLVL